MIEFFNEDCMTVMARYPDNHFDLCIADPPYGIGDTLVKGGTWSVKYQDKGAAWDVKPKKEYFDTLRRVSKNQIIWGGNYFTNHIFPARCFISWVKPNMAGMHTMADQELALTSFDRNARVITLTSQSSTKRIHVTQKPVKLYNWLFQNFAEKGQTILDTHGGSFSSAIAAHYFGVDMVICEIDKDYFNAGKERFERETRQIAMEL